MLRVLIKAYQKLSAAQSQTKQQVQVRLLNIDSFSHSFWRLTQRLFKRLLLRGAPNPVTDKEEGLKRDVKFGLGRPSEWTAAKMEDHSMLINPQPGKDPWLHNLAKRARETKSSPLAAERSTRRAAKTDTEQQRSQR